MEKAIKSGIYKITCTENDKIYIGSAKNINKRWQRHKQALIRNNHGNKHLQSAYNKYGEDKFLFEIIEKCHTSSLIITEQFYIDSLSPAMNIMKKAGDYTRRNRTKGENKGTYKKGHIPTEKNKNKSSEVNRENKYCLGYKHSEEFLVKLKVPIIQLSKEGIIVKEWPSIKDAVVELYKEKYTKSKCNAIGNCLKGGVKSALGYKWIYKNINSQVNKETAKQKQEMLSDVIRGTTQ